MSTCSLLKMTALLFASPSTLFRLYLDWNLFVRLHKHTHMPTQSPPPSARRCLKDSEANESCNYRNVLNPRHHRRLERLTSMKDAELSGTISVYFWIFNALKRWKLQLICITVSQPGKIRAENASATYNLTTEMHLEFDSVHLASILNDGVVFLTTLHSQWKI